MLMSIPHRSSMDNNTWFGSFSFFLFPPPHASFNLFHASFISVTSGFTRLKMKTKYVCRGLISLYVNFHNNWTMWSTNLHVKTCRWGGEGKRAHGLIPEWANVLFKTSLYKNKHKFFALSSKSGSKNTPSIYKPAPEFHG